MKEITVEPLRKAWISLNGPSDKGSTVISFIYPLQNKPLVEALAARGVTSFAMDRIPNLTSQEATEVIGGLQNRLVTCNIGHGAKGIESLRPLSLSSTRSRTSPSSRHSRLVV
jgi:hypothetical protein